MSNIHGHVTRLSDSSVYDKICINCLATDARGSDKLHTPCPKPVGNGGLTFEEWRTEKRRSCIS